MMGDLNDGLKSSFSEWIAMDLFKTLVGRSSYREIIVEMTLMSALDDSLPSTD